MKRHIGYATTIVCLALLAVGGCIRCSSGNSFKARYERTIDLELAMAEGKQLVADTEFGDVRITGTDTDRCSVTARIHVQAQTDEIARTIAEQIEVKLVPTDKGIEIVIDKPKHTDPYSSGAALTIRLPSRADIDARTSFGKVTLAGIEGDVRIHTSFGEVQAEQMTGPLKLDTSFGSIRCSDIRSRSLDLNTSFGSVVVKKITSDAPLSAKVHTSHGSINFDCPTDYVGKIDMETSFGKVRTERPILVKGDIGAQQLKGTMGAGDGVISLRTSFGDIKLN